MPYIAKDILWKYQQTRYRKEVPQLDEQHLPEKKEKKRKKIYR